MTFHIFYTPIATCLTLVDDIVLVCCCLHNMFRGSRTATQEEDNFDIQMPTENIINLSHRGGNTSAIAFYNRNDFRTILIVEQELFRNCWLAVEACYQTRYLIHFI